MFSQSGFLAAVHRRLAGVNPTVESRLVRNFLIVYIPAAIHQ